MRTIVLAVALATGLPAAAFAQATDSTDTGAAAAIPAAPDGTTGFKLEPYVGVLGGYHSFDNHSEFGVRPGRGKVNGGLFDAIAGVNVGVGPGFIGAEGNVGKGLNDIDWEYGVKGRVGLRAGESGMVYLSGGYQWVNGRHGFGDRSDWMYGGGVEVGPKDIGLAGIMGEAGPRIRLQADTYDFHSIRPMAGVVFHF